MLPKIQAAAFFLLAVTAQPASADFEQMKSSCPPRGIVMVIHGLNNKPEAMKPFAAAFNRECFDVILVSLTGHRSEESLDDVTSAQWKENVRSAYTQIAPSSLPKFLFAYSIGATAALGAIEENPAIQFDAMVFLAPAIKFTWRGTLLRLLIPFRFLGAHLPSLSPEELRAHDETSLAAYHASLDLADSLSHPSDKLRNIPALLYVSDADEMVSAAKLERWRRRNKLTNWEIRPAPECTSRYHHLMIERSGYSENVWNTFIQEVAGFFVRVRMLSISTKSEKPIAK